MNRTARPADEHGLRILLLPFTHVRQLDRMRRVALAAATAIAVCALVAIPDFGWLEASQLLVAVACLRLLARAVESHPYASPFQDGTLFIAAGAWTTVVTVINTFDGASNATGAIVVIACGALAVCGLLLHRDEYDDWFEAADREW